MRLAPFLLLALTPLLIPACASIVGFPDVPDIADGATSDGAVSDSTTEGSGSGSGSDSGSSSGADASDASDSGGACTPGSVQCDGLQPQLCGSGGDWSNFGSVCQYICP